MVFGVVVVNRKEKAAITDRLNNISYGSEFAFVDLAEWAQNHGYPVFYEPASGGNRQVFVFGDVVFAMTLREYLPQGQSRASNHGRWDNQEARRKAVASIIGH